MNHQSTHKTFVWNCIWVLIFLVSVSAVTAIRQNLRDRWQANGVQRTLATDAVHMARLTRTVLVP